MASAFLAVWLGGAARAADDAGTDAEASALHAQATQVTQGHSRFRSPYEGANSLAAHGRTEETTDITFYAGRRLWSGAELWVTPEIDQGFGLSNTLGMAGFASGEAYKIGQNQPYLRLPRLFLRQVISLGGESAAADGDLFRLAGKLASERITVTVGKFGVTDVFDNNRYAHDPRADFFNWALIDAGAFDYAADAWGYTYGAAVEWATPNWTARTGVFQMSRRPNGKVVTVDFNQRMWVGEVELAQSWRGRPGALRLLAFINHAPMARYRDAVADARSTGDVPDVARVRTIGTRPGVAVNYEQEIADDLGVFARASVNDGAKEAYEFTEINRSLSAGLALKGSRWARPEDTVGLAGVVNALSRDAREYFAAGGLGILIGDGAMNYKPESILEAYYSYAVHRAVSVTLDYQYVRNPAYNADRGPVSIIGLRLHAQF